MKKRTIYVGELFPDLAMKNTPMYNLKNRRYLGCKTKIADWIFWNILKETHGTDSFIDLFGGTGVISQKALEHFKEVTINDFLFSNNIIYKAFFADGEWDERLVRDFISEMNATDASSLADNLCSQKYGGEFFGFEAAKMIGYVREEIERRRPQLTEKEYCVLLASLIYSADHIANTTGHYEAYCKNTKEFKDFQMRQIVAKRHKGVNIFMEDANILARKVKGDVVYLDPPYNARQYGSLYHVIDELANWDMQTHAKQSSEYCKKNAIVAFTDLVMAIDARYIAVSYSNTNNAKSNTSNNKMTLEQILQTLELRGTTKMIEKGYNAYNAGKTNIANHKEVLFITKVEK